MLNYHFPHGARKINAARENDSINAAKLEIVQVQLLFLLDVWVQQSKKWKVSQNGRKVGIGNMVVCKTVKMFITYLNI